MTSVTDIRPTIAPLSLKAALAGLDIPNGGQSRIAGRDITGMNDDDLTRMRRDMLGFIFQSFNLLPSLSAEENILLPLRLARRSPDKGWYDAIIAAVQLSSRYITDRFLPDKAIDLMDEAAARLRMQVDSVPESLDEVSRRIAQLEIERGHVRAEIAALVELTAVVVLIGRPPFEMPARGEGVAGVEFGHLVHHFLVRVVDLARPRVELCGTSQADALS